jgi:hypothetical protein
MKRKMKKLGLAKETLLGLDEERLQKVRGATDGSERGCAGSYCAQCLSWYDCPITTGSVYC